MDTWRRSPHSIGNKGPGDSKSSQIPSRVQGTREPHVVPPFLNITPVPGSSILPHCEDVCSQSLRRNQPGGKHLSRGQWLGMGAGERARENLGRQNPHVLRQPARQYRPGHCSQPRGQVHWVLAQSQHGSRLPQACLPPICPRPSCLPAPHPTPQPGSGKRQHLTSLASNWLCEPGSASCSMVPLNLVFQALPQALLCVAVSCEPKLWIQRGCSMLCISKTSHSQSVVSRTHNTNVP